MRTGDKDLVVLTRHDAFARCARILLIISGGLVLISLWVGVAPRSVGGNTSYVITNGTSMLPKFSPYGLVVTRARSVYRVGDVVAYKNRELDALVMHRIVAIEGGHYVLKGDNNDFRDRYHPLLSDIVGAQWLYLPRLGAYLLALRDPVTFGAIVGLVALMSLRPVAKNRRARRHHGW